MKGTIETDIGSSESVYSTHLTCSVGVTMTLEQSALETDVSTAKSRSGANMSFGRILFILFLFIFDRIKNACL